MRCHCSCVCGVCKGCACGCHALFDTISQPMLRAIMVMHGEPVGKTRNQTLFIIANSKKRAALLRTVRKCAKRATPRRVAPKKKKPARKPNPKPKPKPRPKPKPKIAKPKKKIAKKPKAQKKYKLVKRVSRGGG